MRHVASDQRIEAVSRSVRVRVSLAICSLIALNSPSYSFEGRLSICAASELVPSLLWLSAMLWMACKVVL